MLARLRSSCTRVAARWCLELMSTTAYPYRGKQAAELLLFPFGEWMLLFFRFGLIALSPPRPLLSYTAATSVCGLSFLRKEKNCHRGLLGVWYATNGNRLRILDSRRTMRHA